jgi:hypothetical protein
MPPDLAANYLNNDFHQSYTNSWQYNVVVKAPTTYQNKKFEEKEELRESHILWELDKEKTYFRSAMEKINPYNIKTQNETEKLKRTEMLNALNSNIMEKTSNDGLSLSKGSGSLKKLVSSVSKKKSPEREGESPKNFSSAISNGGNSPIKLMSMTMTQGFITPKNGL